MYDNGVNTPHDRNNSISVLDTGITIQTTNDPISLNGATTINAGTYDYIRMDGDSAVIASNGDVNITSNNDSGTYGDIYLTKVNGSQLVVGTSGTAITGTLGVSGTTTTNGINNTGDGITNAGAVSGVTTLSASDQITSGSLSTGAITAGAITATSVDAGSGAIQTTGTVSGGTGTFTTLSATKLGGTLNANGNDISNVDALGATTVTATTGNITTLTSTTINNSGTTTLSGATTVGSTLDVTGATTLKSTLDAQGSISNSKGNVKIDDALDVTGATSITSTLTSTGNTTLGTAASTTNTIGSLGNGSTTGSSNTIQGATNVIDGYTSNTMQGATNVINGYTSSTVQSGTNSVTVAATGGTTVIGDLTAKGSINVIGVAPVSGVGGSSNTIRGATNTITGTTNSITGTTNNITGTTNNIGGTTNINTTGGAMTNIATIDAATTNIGVSGGSNVIKGTTSINDDVENATNINTGISTGAVTIGNSANITYLNSATNNIGVSSAYATVNNIGTDARYASTNTIGNTNPDTTVKVYGGNSTLSVHEDKVRLYSGAGNASNGTDGNLSGAGITGGGGYAAYSATNVQTVGANTTIGNALSGVQYVNKINGNTLVDGNVYINGTLNYVSSNTATTSVVGQGATGATVAGTSVVNAGEKGGVAIDANGKLTANATPTQTTSALTVTNTTTKETHGFVVNETQATMSGGTRSTSLTLNDGGAFFSNSATGKPVRVTGVQDGTSSFDAVNFRQLRQVYAGVAGTAAMANIPQVDQNKTFAVGVGLGNFQGMTAVAVGASYRMAPNAVLRASVSSVNGDGNNVVAGVGAGFSW